MLKFIGAVLVTAAGAFVGEMEVCRLKDRVIQLTELVELLEQIQLYLSAYGASTEELFKMLSSKQGEYHSCFQTSSSELTQEVCAALRESCLEMKDDLADYIYDFGKTTLDGQLQKTSILMSDVNAVLRSVKEKCEKNTKLYRAAGFSIGMMAAVLLI